MLQNNVMSLKKKAVAPVLLCVDNSGSVLSGSVSVYYALHYKFTFTLRLCCGLFSKVLPNIGVVAASFVLTPSHRQTDELYELVKQLETFSHSVFDWYPGRNRVV